MPIVRTKFDKEKLEEIDRIFEEGTHQAEVLYAVYGLAIPDFDRMVKYEGWPKCGEKFWYYVSHKFIRFDEKHHPGVFAGGIWMNSGFSTLNNGHLDPWEVEVNLDDIVYEVTPCPYEAEESRPWVIGSAMSCKECQE